MLAFIFKMVGKIGRWFGKTQFAHASLEVAKWTAFKLLLAGFWFTGVYVLLSKFSVHVMNVYAGLAPKFVDAEAPVSSLALQFSGVGAYLASELMLVDSFVVFVSGLSLAVLRMFIPLPRWGA